MLDNRSRGSQLQFALLPHIHKYPVNTNIRSCSTNKYHSYCTAKTTNVVYVRKHKICNRRTLALFTSSHITSPQMTIWHNTTKEERMSSDGWHLIATNEVTIELCVAVRLGRVQVWKKFMPEAHIRTIHIIVAETVRFSVTFISCSRHGSSKATSMANTSHKHVCEHVCA